MLHVVQISFFLDPQGRTPARMLEDWWSLTACADMAAQAGARVTVIQACATGAQLTHNGVPYHFIPPERARAGISGGSAFARIVQELKADVFHVHGLGFPRDVVALATQAPRIPILLQDHANGVPPFWRIREHRRGMSVAAGVCFCARPQAEEFRQARLLQAHTKVFEIAESSSAFSPGDRQAARQLTGVRGDPALLWVGHLNENKDPMTVLDGISSAVQELPNLELWCCFGQAPLLSQVRARIDGDPGLRGRVHLLGKVSHPTVENLMRAADLFVLGSHREGSGYSLIEALACGLPPVVTDIPSFRMLTGGGRVGALWETGAAGSLCEALVKAARLPRREQRELARAQFERELSFSALGVKLVAAYRSLLQFSPPAPAVGAGPVES